MYIYVCPELSQDLVSKLPGSNFMIKKHSSSFLLPQSIKKTINLKLLCKEL